MAKLEKTLSGNFDALLKRIEDGVLNASVSASLEDSCDWCGENSRCSVRVFERYSYAGGNRVSFRIVAAGNVISLRMDDAVVLEYQDPMPILCGYNGFHVRNCTIARGTLR